MISYLPLSEIKMGAVVLQVWGLFVSLGFLSALWLSLREARRKRIEEGIVWDVMIVALVGMIIGGRMFYLLQSEGKDFSSLLDPHGGFTLIGGAIAAGVLSLAYLAQKKQAVGKFFDAMTPGIVAALILVRVGCLLVNDHVGSITSSPLAVAYTDGSLRHPVALYHVIFLCVILYIILKAKVKRKRDGFLFFMLCVLYAAFGFITDFSRCGDLDVCDPHFSGLTATQWILLVAMAASLGVWKRYLSSSSRAPGAKDTEPMAK